MRCVVNENFKVFHGHSPVKLEKGQVVSGSLAELLLRSARKKVTALDDDAPAEDGKQESKSPGGSPGPGTELDIEAPISDVLTWVGDDRERATKALGQEQAKDTPRSTLVKQLEKLAAPGA